MPHVLIIGMTESGKTTLATGLSEQYRQRGIKTIVLDPMFDQRWAADFFTTDKALFLSVVQHPGTRSCAVFVDESAELIGQYHDEMFWLATRGRHYGHNCHFIAQRAKQLAKTVRDQCSYLFLFNCSFDDAKELSNEFNRPELRHAHTLKRGDYFECPRWGSIQKKSIF